MAARQRTKEEIEKLHIKIGTVLKDPTVRDLALILINEQNWDYDYTVNLFSYLRKSIIDILQANPNSMYRNIDVSRDNKSKHVIVDNMISDVLERIIEDRNILRYDEEAENFNDDDLKLIMEGIDEKNTEQVEPSSTGRKGGKRSKNNKKKSKRKHQNNKKSHKKRR